ncbi:MAG: N-acetyltransferase [Thermosynechococcaceae cyanobacterium]
MEKQIIVRPLQLEDIPAVADLLSSVFYPSNGWFSWVSPILKLGIYQDLKTHYFARSSQYVCLVGIDPSESGQCDRAIVGSVEVSVRSLIAWSPFEPSVPYISNLAVARSFRGRGVGKQLLLACEPVANRWGFGELYLHVKGDNRAARNLYINVGYRTYRSEMPAWVRLLGHPQQLLLRKRLTSYSREG